MIPSGGRRRTAIALLVLGAAGRAAAADDLDTAIRKSADARALLERALALEEKRLGPTSPELLPTLDKLSELFYDQGDWSGAERVDRRVLEIRIASQGEGHVDVANARCNLALDLYRLGHFGEEEAVLRKALAWLERARPPATEKLADALAYLAEAVRAQGRYREAEPLFRRALSVGPSSRSSALSNLAGFYRDQNRYGEALWTLSRALELEEAASTPNRPRIVTLWNNMAELYRFQGDEREAERYYKQAVAGAREVYPPGHSRLGTFLNQMAELYREEGRLAEAEPLFREALAIKTAALGPGHPDVAHTHEGLGRLLAAAGRSAEAEAELRRSLDIRTARLGARHPDTADARVALAELLSASRGREGEASALLDVAVEDLGRSTASARSRARALSIRASLRRAAGERGAARADLLRVVDLVERLRPEAGGAEQTRARFGAIFASDVARLAAWLVEDGDVDRAFSIVERGRGRALLDQLAAAHADILDGVPPGEREALQHREAAVLARLTADRSQLDALDASPSADAATREALERRIAEAEADYERLYEDARNASVLWRGVGSRRAADVSTAQRGAVPPGGILLSYLVDASGVLLFVVPPPGERARAARLVVPPDAAETLGVEPGPLDASKLQRILAPETLDPTSADGLLARLGRAPAADGVRPALARTLEALFRVLVPPDVWARVRASREVVVVPDQLLHRLPFEALVLANGPRGPRFWLDDAPPVRYAHSATTLLAIAGRPTSDATRGVVSVADPDWEAPAGGSANPSLEPLPGTAREAAGVREAFAREGLAAAVTSLERSEAREPEVRAALERGRYLHVATHGLVDDRRGELFASLALTPPRADATPGDDGLLQLHEVLRLRLDARATVLSACESRVGAIVDGEGVFALSRAFLIAGSQRVVATLWPAADESSAGLVAAFFGDLARAEAGKEKADYAASLARAKRQVRAQPAFSDPFFWAPFVLEGVR